MRVSHRSSNHLSPLLNHLFLNTASSQLSSLVSPTNPTIPSLYILLLLPSLPNYPTALSPCTSQISTLPLSRAFLNTQILQHPLSPPSCPLDSPATSFEKVTSAKRGQRSATSTAAAGLRWTNESSPTTKLHWLVDSLQVESS